MNLFLTLCVVSLRSPLGPQRKPRWESGPWCPMPGPCRLAPESCIWRGSSPRAWAARRRWWWRKIGWFFGNGGGVSAREVSGWIATRNLQLFFFFARDELFVPAEM